MTSLKDKNAFKTIFFHSRTFHDMAIDKHHYVSLLCTTSASCISLLIVLVHMCWNSRLLALVKYWRFKGVVYCVWHGVGDGNNVSTCMYPCSVLSIAADIMVEYNMHNNC